MNSNAADGKVMMMSESLCEMITSRLVSNWLLCTFHFPSFPVHFPLSCSIFHQNRFGHSISTSVAHIPAFSFSKFQFHFLPPNSKFPFPFSKLQVSLSPCPKFQLSLFQIPLSLFLVPRSLSASRIPNSLTLNLMLFSHRWQKTTRGDRQAPRTKRKEEPKRKTKATNPPQPTQKPTTRKATGRRKDATMPKRNRVARRRNPTKGTPLKRAHFSHLWLCQ